MVLATELNWPQLPAEDCFIASICYVVGCTCHLPPAHLVHVKSALGTYCTYLQGSERTYCFFRSQSTGKQPSASSTQWYHNTEYHNPTILSRSVPSVSTTQKRAAAR